MYFALYLKGKGNNKDSDTIPEEMNEFIVEALEAIHQNFDIDLTDNINLRITLGLHCMALSIRIQYDMQIKNEIFHVSNSAKKEDILKKICDSATEYFELEGLHEQVIAREEIGSTFFSKNIAVPHPMYAVSSDTFVVVYFSKTPVIWDEEKNKVNLVMLMHVGKNNPQAFQLWNYFSKIFASKTLVSRLGENPTHENFISLIKNALEMGINSNEI